MKEYLLAHVCEVFNQSNHYRHTLHFCEQGASVLALDKQDLHTFKYQITLHLIYETSKVKNKQEFLKDSFVY